MTKTGRPKRGQLERDLIVAQQQRDKAYAARDEAIRQMNRAIADAAEARRRPRPLHERVTEPFRRWLDELAKGLGL